MRVAFVTHYVDLYGANRSLLDLIDDLGSRGIAAHVICPGEGMLTAELLARGVPVAVAPMRSWLWPNSVDRTWRARLGRLRTNLVGTRVILRLLAEWDIDLVYTNSFVLPTGALASLASGRPHVWHLREFGDLDYSMLPDWPDIVCAWWLRRADAQVAVSHAVGSHHRGRAGTGRLHVVYNGVTTAAHLDRLRTEAQARRREPGSFVFGLVGLLAPSKGQDTAIRALALLAESHPEARLVLVGGGNERFVEQCKDLAAQLRIGARVELAGFQADPWPCYLRFDAALMCSAFEAMGRVTAEAMAACCPVIGHDSAGTSEIIEHERTGLLYRGGAPELAACMKRLLTAPAAAEEMGQRGWERARERFTIERYGAEIHAILRDVAARRGTRAR